MRPRGEWRVWQALPVLAMISLIAGNANALFDPGEPVESIVAEATRTYRQTSPAFMGEGYKLTVLNLPTDPASLEPSGIRQKCETASIPTRNSLAQPVCRTHAYALRYEACAYDLCGTDTDPSRRSDSEASVSVEDVTTPVKTTDEAFDEEAEHAVSLDDVVPPIHNVQDVIGLPVSAQKPPDPEIASIEASPIHEKQAETLPSDEVASLKHRWNFASLDCAAVVHRTNPSAKFASSILSEKKDRYMLSPCPSAGGEAQFVIIELCDEIKIDTLVLANFEFFSRMFKRFRVHVSRNLNGGDDEWLDIGTFRARNVRGLQVFKTPEPAGDARFFRYIRIDFMEHYGSEYYCPLSLVRVYGLTQMDDYIREEEELRKAQDAENADLKVAADNGIGVEHGRTLIDSTHVQPSTVSEAASSADSQSTTESASTSEQNPPPASSEFPQTSFDSQATSELIGRHSPSRTPSSTESPPPTVESVSEHGLSSVSFVSAASVRESHFTTTVPSSDYSNDSTIVASIAVQSINATNGTVRQPAANSTNLVRSQGSNGTAPATNHTHGGSESIYRTITKRLNMLEANATQSRHVLTEMFTRLERDQGDRISRLLSELNDSNWRQVESLKRRQQVDLQQALFEFDLHRQQTDVERRALLAQVHLLSNEVMLEKRFGIAQLVLLLGLFVFMALTRGSRAAPWINDEVSRKLNRVSSASAHNRRSSPLSTSRPNTPTSNGRIGTRRFVTPKRSGSVMDEELGDATPRQNGRMRKLYDVDRLIFPSVKRLDGLRPGLHGSIRRNEARRQGSRIEYSVRLPGGINAKVPARRRGGQLMLPAMSIAVPVHESEQITETGTASPTSSSCSSSHAQSLS